MEEKVGNEPAVDVASGRDGDALARAEADVDGGVGAAFDESLVGGGNDGGNLVDASVEVGVRLEVVLEGLGLGAAEAGDGLLCGLFYVEHVPRSKAAVVWSTYVGDHVDLEGEREHVRVKTSLRELGRLLRSLRLLEDDLQGLKRVLDRHDGSVVDGVDHCERLRYW